MIVCEYGVSFLNDKSAIKLIVVIVTHLCGYIKNH